MAVTCKNCDGAHAIWECKRPATKSTETGKDRLRRDGIGGGLYLNDAPRESRGSPPEGGDTASKDGALEAGTQALPVDTKSMPHANGVRDGKDKLPSTQKQLIDASSEKGSQGFKSPVGQTPKFDKKAWSRAYMKIWMRNKRAKLKADTVA